MMSRTTNASALMQWIGSIFDPDADLQQYVWLYGGGQNGKSALGRFLSQVLGGGARSVQPPGLNDKFWTINLIGKRLVIYADCNNAKFVTCGLFKSMTGGDPVPAEIKLGATLQVVLKAKHLFFSNKKPGISASMADQRRIILCEMSPIVGEPDPFYEDRLWAEAPTFLGECINQYLDQSGPKRRIKTEDQAAKDLAFDHEEMFESIFHQCFAEEPGETLVASKFINSLINFGIRDPERQRLFREYCETNHGLVRVRTKKGNIYHNIRFAAATKTDEV
jgi:phage/plasmid-associated DNA primase